MRFKKTALDRGRNLIERYCLATGKTLYRLSDVYDWARERQELPMGEEAVRLVNLQLLEEASRTDTVEGPKGKVRLRHCVEGITSNGDSEPHQETLWAHVDDAPYAFIFESFRQRRGRVAADVRQLKADLDFVNERYRARGEREIQLNFDFSDDEAEEDDSETA